MQDPARLPVLGLASARAVLWASLALHTVRHLPCCISTWSQLDRSCRHPHARLTPVSASTFVALLSDFDWGRGDGYESRVLNAS